MLENNYLYKNLFSLMQLLQDENFCAFEKTFNNIKEILNESQINFVEIDEIESFLSTLYSLKDNFVEEFIKYSNEDDYKNIINNIKICKFEDAHSEFIIIKNNLDKEFISRYNKIKKEVKSIKNQVIGKTSCVMKKITSNLFDKQKKIKKNISSYQSNQPHNDVNKIWILKSNLIMVNSTYNSNLTYEEFIDFLDKNLHKAYKNN